MKFNIAYPLTGAQKKVEIDDDKKCSIFYDKRMGAEVEADALGDEFKGYIFKIAGGNDKDGFPMKQGVMVKGRCRLLLSKGHSTYRPRRKGERKRKSVRGCIVGQDIQVLCLTVVKKGEKDIEGLTNRQCPRTLGPKRASKIRKLFALTKEETKGENQALIKKSVVRRTWTAPNGKKRQKAPKIQRIVTEERRRRKRIYKAHKKEGWKKEKAQHDEFKKLIQEWKKKKLTAKADADKKAAEEKAQPPKQGAKDAKVDDKKKQQPKVTDAKVDKEKTQNKKQPVAEKKPVEKKADKPAEVKKDEKKPAETKKDEKKQEVKKPAEKKEEKKPAETKKEDKKPADKKK